MIFVKAVPLAVLGSLFLLQAPDLNLVQAKIKQLSSANFTEREAATQWLRERPETAPAPRKALPSADLEAARCIRLVLDYLDRRPVRDLQNAVKEGEVEQFIKLVADWPQGKFEPDSANFKEREAGAQWRPRPSEIGLLPGKALSLGSLQTARPLKALAGAWAARSRNQNPQSPVIREGFPWKESTNRALAELPATVWDVCFVREDLVAVVVTREQTSEVWFCDLREDKLLPEKLSLGEVAPCRCGVSSCGTYFVTAGKGNRTSHLVLWDMQTKKRLWEATDFNRLNLAAFFPQGKKIVALDFFTGRIFDTKSPRPIAEFPIDPGFYSYVDFSTDAKEMYIFGHAFARFHVFDDSGKCKASIPCKEFGIRSLVSTSDGLYLSSCNKRILHYANHQLSERLEQTKGCATCKASPDGRWLAVSDERFTIWHLSEQKPYFQVPTAAAQSAFSPRGDYFILITTKGGKNSASVWKAAKGEPK